MYVSQSQFSAPTRPSHESSCSGADVVEVAPAYDHADITAIAAADIVHDFLSLFVSAEPPKPRSERRLRRADEL
jgi:agmatinase